MIFTGDLLRRVVVTTTICSVAKLVCSVAMSALPRKSGHVRCTEACPLWANSGHRTAVNRKTASVAVLAKSDQVYRLVTAVAFFHCEANRAAHAILKNLGGDFVAWLSSSSE